MAVQDSTTEPARWLTMRAAARYASLGRVTLFRLVKEKAIVSRLVAPRKRLVDRESLDAWILACPEEEENAGDMLIRAMAREPHHFASAPGLHSCALCGRAAIDSIHKPAEWQ